MRFTYASGARPLTGYTIKRGIGRGGFGEVYYAISDAGKEVALKLIRRHLEVELRGVKHCLNLRHPHLLSIHDIRTDDLDDRWVVMDYMAGSSLEEVIERNPNGMPVAEVLRWIRGIAEAVAYLHDHGIVHRDLKPGNIFMDEGTVKIGDYGLSKFVSCSRRSGQTESVGTVHYMAPEIANGRYGKEIDTYALGIILYEMLTGSVPFEGESVGEVLMKHLTAEPDVNSLQEPFRALCKRALAKDPLHRVEGAAAFLAALPDPGRPAQAAPPMAPPRSAPSRGQPDTTGERVPYAERAPLGAAFVKQAAEEPIWRTGRDALYAVRVGWSRMASKLPAPLRLGANLMGILVLIATASFWVGPLFALLCLYVPYYIIRSLVLVLFGKRGRTPESGRLAEPPAPSHLTATQLPESQTPQTGRRVGRHAVRRRHQRRPDKTLSLPPKSLREKLTECTGSMLIACLVALTMSVVMLVVRQGDMRSEQFVWLSLVGVLGSWAVMVPSKIWEGTLVDHAARRFTLLGMGLGLGATAFGLAQYLNVDLLLDNRFPKFVDLSHSFYEEARGVPLLFAYLAYFGFLLFAIRWWKQADPLREARVSLWSVAVTLFAALVLNMFWPFPQPWGMMVVAIMAVSVQLASTWLPPSARPTSA